MVDQIDGDHPLVHARATLRYALLSCRLQFEARSQDSVKRVAKDGLLVAMSISHRMWGSTMSEQ